MQLAGERQKEGGFFLCRLNVLVAIFFAVLAVILVSVLSVKNSFAIDNYSLFVSSDNVVMNETILATPDETINVQKQTLTMTTNSPNGLKLFVSSRDSRTAPTYVAGSSPADASGFTTIAEASGTMTAPGELAVNSFGVGLAKSTGGLADNFSEQNIYENTNEKIRMNAKFAKLGTNDNLTEIYRGSGVHDNAKFAVYYGTKVNNLMREGKYEMEVIYTAVSGVSGIDLSEADNGTVEISPKRLAVKNSQDFYGENTIKVMTNIKAGKAINPNEVAVKIDGKPCINVNILQNFSMMSGRMLELTCAAPKNVATNAGVKYDVTVTIEKYKLSVKKKNAIEYLIPIEMQKFEYDQCAAMQTHEKKTMIDIRDKELYTVAKMKDGKCWMTQNLRLKLNKNVELTASDSDVTEKWKPNNGTEATIVGGWNGDADGYKTVRSYYNEDDPESGAYYTHAAATAGTAANINNRGEDASGSICPNGWKLPKTGMAADAVDNDFYNLATHYKGDAVWQVSGAWGYWNGNHEMLTGAPNFRLAGGRSATTATLNSAGRYGYVWSSTVNNSNGAQFMQIMAGSVGSGGYSARYEGMNVRCVKKKAEKAKELKYMQDLTTEICAKMGEHETVSLIDKRDNNTYVIAKLKDTRCWMTQNLKLILNTNTLVKPEDSDVQSNWTPARNTEQALSGRWDRDSESYVTVRSYFDQSNVDNGVYYTYMAATAGTGGDGSAASGSICPKGWKLPSGNEMEEVVKKYSTSALLLRYAGVSALINDKPNFKLMGYRNYSSATMKQVGSYGGWWTSTTMGTDSAQSFDLYSGSAYPKKTNYKYYGFNVRCIVEKKFL